MPYVLDSIIYMYILTCKLMHIHSFPYVSHRLMSNYETLTRRLRMQNEDCDQLTEKLNRKERTKNSLDMELNNLKPRIKSLQAEKGTILR